jgi:AcrR family transcriptional regulator
MSVPLRPAEKADSGRRRRLLDAAVGVFMRYGFRKSSMDEVARAAGISRQGLYLSFATKEDLFREAVAHVLRSGLEAATARLGDEGSPLEARLVGAFDEWVGRYVGAIGGDATDLHEASKALVGDLIAEHEGAFTSAVAKVFRESGLAAAYKAASLGARDLAEVLHATARGLKTTSASRTEFVTNMTHAVRAMCLPVMNPKRTSAAARRHTT